MVKSKTTRSRFLVAGEFAAVGATAVILLVFLASSLDGLLIRSGQGAAVITAILVDLANTDRSENQVRQLQVSPTLTAIAQAKANDMAAKSYFAHTSPDGHDPWYWFKQGGYLFSYAGENLAIDFSDSAAVEAAWMNSPTHRENLLNPNFTEIGIATAVGTYQGHQTTYVVQEFGTPAHVASAAPPQNLTAPTEPTQIAIATTEKKPAAQKPAAKPVPAAPKASTSPVLAQGAPTTTQTVLGTAATGLVAPRPQGFASLWNVFAASPKTTLEYAYTLFAVLILVALIIETGLEIKKHHVRHIAIALALLVLMTGLFVVADSLVFTHPIITFDAASLTGAG